MSADNDIKKKEANARSLGNDQSIDIDSGYELSDDEIDDVNGGAGRYSAASNSLIVKNPIEKIVKIFSKGGNDKTTKA